MRDFILKRLAAELARCGITDANETLAYSRELEAFIATMYELEFSELAAMNLFPADPPVDPAMTSYTSRQMREQATAIIISNWTTELPSASYDSRGEANFPIRSAGNQYVVTIQDLRTAAYLNIPLETKLAEACKRAHAELFEQICFFGDSTFGLKGLFSDAGVAANGTAKVGVAWDNAAVTVEIILADIDRMWNKIEVDTKRILKPDTLVLGTAAMNVFTRPIAIGTAGIFKSMKELVLDIYKPRGLVNIEYAAKLDIGTTGLPGGAPRALMYKKDPKVLAHQTPVFFEQFLPQAHGLALITPCHSRLGGVHVEQHKAITFMDGITS